MSFELWQAEIERAEARQLQSQKFTGVVGAASANPSPSKRARAGEWVEVRSKEEILATLDGRGRLDGLPFMPQMFQYCGQQFQVYKRAHKTCDTVSGNYRGRLIPDGVHLDLRCDGKAYGGCQAGCLIFWKEAWLKPVTSTGDGSEAQIDGATERLMSTVAACTELHVQKATRRSEAMEPGYVCQATELLNYTRPLQWWDLRHYAEDYTSGNATIKRLCVGMIYSAYLVITQAFNSLRGKLGRWLYERVHSIRGVGLYPSLIGPIPAGSATRRDDLNLEPGNLVRVKSRNEILAMVNKPGANRNMNFHAELLPFCGQLFRVRNRVEKFIEAPTGRLKTLNKPAIILEGAYCQGCYSSYRMFCPRNRYIWWQEDWLERPPGDTKDQIERSSLRNISG